MEKAGLGVDCSDWGKPMGRKTARIAAAVAFFALLAPCRSMMSFLKWLLLKVGGSGAVSTWLFVDERLYSSLNPWLAALAVLALRCVPAFVLAVFACRYLVRRSPRQVFNDCAAHKGLAYTLFAVFALFAVFSFSVTSTPVAADPELTSLRSDWMDDTGPVKRVSASWNHCDFAARLYCAAAPKAPGENFVVSPCGVASGLALMGSGSCGDTLREIRRALSMKDEWEGDAEGAQQDFCDVMVFQRAVLRASSDDASRVETADAIWLASDVRLTGPFDCAKSLVGAEVLRDDAAVSIKKFAASKTQGLMPDFSPAPVDPETRMIAVNAVSFKGEWKRKFREIETYLCPFKTPDGEVTVPFMHSLMPAELCECDGVRALRLPYLNEKIEMVFVLPPEGQPLSSLEGRLGADFLGRLLASGQMKDEVDVALPRFEIENGISLKGALSAMGMEKAFSKVEADFSEAAKEPLYVSDVWQSTVLRVDEAGTEAAAVTKVRALAAAAGMDDFCANRPFLFVLREKAHGVVMFIGRVASPRARHVVRRAG